jgi:hypothetical protein
LQGAQKGNDGADLFIRQPPLPGQPAHFYEGKPSLNDGLGWADHTVAWWKVDNIEEVARALRERGVVFEQYDLPGLKTDERGIATIGPTKSAWFKDSEGNILAISEFG